MKAIILDLDQTIIDTSKAEGLRKNGKWHEVYGLIPEFILYDGIRELLNYVVEEGLVIGIVTSSPSSYCLKVLSHWSIPFHTTVCYHDTRFKKPHPDPIKKALLNLGLNSNFVLSLGDRVIDIEASKSAGVKSVACTWGSSEIELLKNSNATPRHLRHPLDFQNVRFNRRLRIVRRY